ncbi:MAG: hypothetical protein OXI88_16365, partial [Gammaproteobacteria bacterium]|nr:hypothetical protein [Gammaproteobacteria bacterium]
YQPDENPPLALVISLGLQLAGLNIAAVVLVPTVIVRAAGETEAYLSWAVLTAVMICGMTTILQALRFGRIGAGHIIVMCSSAAFIPVCIMALAAGGRPGHDGHPGRYCVPGPTGVILEATAVPAHPDTHGLGDDHHADTHHDTAGSLRTAWQRG